MTNMGIPVNPTTRGIPVTGLGGSSSSSAVGGGEIPNPFGGMPFSSQCRVMSRNATNASTGTSRTAHQAPFYGTDIRVYFENFFNSNDANVAQDVDGTANQVYTVSIEYPATVIYRVTFAGQAILTLAPGGAAVSDPVPIEIPAGATYWVRVFTNGTAWHSNKVAYISGEGGITAGTDLTPPGSGVIADAGSFTLLLSPMAVLATPVNSVYVPSLLGVADSIGFGTGDGPSTWGNAVNTNNANLGGDGFIGRAATLMSCAASNIAMPGDTAANFILNATHFRRMTAARIAKTAICAYGRNDVSGGATLGSIQATLLTLWTMMSGRGLRAFQTTITPRSSSTDGWITVANQAPSPGGSIELTRVALNVWLRNGAPIVNGVAAPIGTNNALLAGSAGHPLYGVLDVAGAVENSPDSGIWTPGGNQRSGTDATTVAGNFNPTSTGALTSDVGRTLIIQGAGTAGAPFVSLITAANPGVSWAVQPTAPATAIVGTGVWTVADNYTVDGLHPQSTAAKLMAQVVANQQAVML